jgi:hypothetical protein
VLFGPLSAAGGCWLLDVVSVLRSCFFKFCCTTVYSTYFLFFPIFFCAIQPAGTQGKLTYNPILRHWRTPNRCDWRTWCAQTTRVEEYCIPRSWFVDETTLSLTLLNKRCNRCRTMIYKFVIKEDFCLTELLNKTKIMN